MLRIGIDIGGTFTDLIAWRSDGAKSRTVSLKVPSTPSNYAEGFKNGLKQVLDQFGDVAHDDIIIMHGTTISTNTVIERAAPPIALLTTAGFRDILNIQRLRLRNPTNMFEQRVPALVPRELVFEIEERMLFDGSVRNPIDRDNIVAAVKKAQARGATGFAVAFYHSYRNPQHEIFARDVIRDTLGDVEVSISSEIWPQVGEYERTMIAVLNTFVKPKMKLYTLDIEKYLSDYLPKARLFITRSNGGAMSIDEARKFPVQTLLSGPASGVTAALALAKRLDDPSQYLTFDMGGTSTDVSLIRNHTPMVSTTSEVGDFPISMPVTDIEAIGAGGGSIITLDAGVMRVGPQSAGARPGPASFGHGGTAPTVSDAFLLSGYIDPNNFLGGRMKLDTGAAERALQPIADSMSLSIREAAEAALSVATSNMVARVMPYLARHGVDPEEVTLIVCGGAGSLHGPLLAQEVGIRRVLVPPTPSVFCASGGLVTRLVNDTVQTVHGQEMTAKRLHAWFADLDLRAGEWLAAQVEPDQLVDVEIEHSAQMRYRGQSFQIQLRVPDAALQGDLAPLIEAFHAEHERLYSHADRDNTVEYLQLRSRISGALPAPDPERDLLAPLPREGARTGVRRIRIAGKEYEAAIYDRAKLGVGSTLAGPAIIEQSDTTILVPHGFNVVVNRFGDITMSKE